MSKGKCWRPLSGLSPCAAPNLSEETAISENDLIRSDINRVYNGFNRDCGARGALLARPTVSRPTNADDFIRLTIDKEKGDGFWDLLRIQEGLLLCVADGKYADIFNYFVSPATDIISLRIIVSGDLELNGRAPQNISFHRGAATLLKTPKHGDHEIKIDDAAPLSSVTMHFHADRFAELVGLNEEGAPPELAPLFDAGGDLQYWSTPLSPSMAKSAHDLVQTPFAGVLRRRYFEAKALEIMCHFMDAAQNPPNGAVAGDAQKVKSFAAIKAARRILEDNVAAPPTVAQLARLVGVNRTQLRRDFKRVYGETLSAFLVSYRMKIAWSLLVDESCSVRTVAEAVGYQHPGNFAAAFQRYYGVSPKSVKRS